MDFLGENSSTVGSDGGLYGVGSFLKIFYSIKSLRYCVNSGDDVKNVRC